MKCDDILRINDQSEKLLSIHRTISQRVKDKEDLMWGAGWGGEPKTIEGWKKVREEKKQNKR